MRLFDQLLWKLVEFNVASNGHRCECEYMAEQRTALDRAERLLGAVFITEILGGGESLPQKNLQSPLNRCQIVCSEYVFGSGQ